MNINNNKWIVFDTLMSIECSRAAIEFADRWFNENGYPEVEGNLAGIIISHSHVDHFGGIRGLFKDFKVDPSVPIYVPEGFTEAAISENSSGVNLSFGAVKSTSFSLFIGIRWMCAWGTSRPKTTVATLLQPLNDLIFCATCFAKTIIPCNVSSSRSYR